VTTYDDDDLERIFRAGLTHHAADAPVQLTQPLPRTATKAGRSAADLARDSPPRVAGVARAAQGWSCRPAAPARPARQGAGPCPPPSPAPSSPSRSLRNGAVRPHRPTRRRHWAGRRQRQERRARPEPMAQRDRTAYRRIGGPSPMAGCKSGCLPSGAGEARRPRRNGMVAAGWTAAACGLSLCRAVPPTSSCRTTRHMSVGR